MLLNGSFLDTPIKIPSGLLLQGGLSSGSIRRLIGTGLMFVVIFEAAVLGSGQIVHVAGPVTAKMFLFALSIGYTLLSLLNGDKIRKSTTLLVASYFVYMAVSCLIGILRDAPLDRIGTDVDPLLSFLLLPFFELTVRTKRDVGRVIQTIILGAGVITCAYIAILGLLWSGRVSYTDLAAWLGSLNPSTGMGDFLFDSTTQRVFYKGAIYLGIALICFLFRQGLWAKMAALFMAVDLLAIGARGFFLALFISALVYVVIGPIRTSRKMALIIPVILMGVLLLPRLFLLAGDRSVSNNERIVTAQQVLHRTNGLSVVIGNGFGFGVPERPEHMEIVPLEIFYKQGILGLCWWGALLAIVIARFARALRSGNATLAYPLFLSAVFIAAESCTNPYINNPIGMTFITVAMASLGVLGQERNLFRSATA